MKHFSIVLTLAAVLSAALPAKAADYAAQVQNLIPRLADADVPARYAAQMELQDLASDSSKPGNEEARRALGTALADVVADESVAQPARVWIVRQLEYMGADEAVPALTALLANEDAELRECARRALEKNPARAATNSLREALQKGGDARWRIGLINALAEKGDRNAAGMIEDALKDPATADAAARVLGRLERGVLLDRMNDSPEVSLALAGSWPSEVYKRSTFPPARAAALYAIANNWEIIAQALVGTDPFLRHTALNASEKLGPAGMPLLAGLLPYLSPVASVEVIGRLDQSVEPQIIKAMDDPDDAVRLMAIKRLGQVGTAASVEALLEAAADDERAGSAEARTALVTMRGKDVVEKIEARASETARWIPLLRVAAIDALVARELPSALPVLRRCATEPGRVGAAAVAGLGRLGGATELLPLARVALNRQDDESWAALEQVAGRVEDGEAGAKELLALADGNARALRLMLGTLGTLGGSGALEVVSGFLNGPDAGAAIEALAKWPDLGSAGTLLKVATDDDVSAGQRTQAFNGLLDLLRNSESVPAAERGDTVLAVWKATRDNDEKKRVLSAMGGIPDGRLAETIQPLFENADLKAEAVAAATGLAEGLLETNKDAAVELAKAVQATEPPNAVRRRLGRILRN